MFLKYIERNGVEKRLVFNHTVSLEDRREILDGGVGVETWIDVERRLFRKPLVSVAVYMPTEDVHKLTEPEPEPCEPHALYDVVFKNGSRADINADGYTTEGGWYCFLVGHEPIAEFRIEDVFAVFRERGATCPVPVNGAPEPDPNTGPKVLIDFLPEFILALTEQLLSDQERWGDTWKHRPVEATEDMPHQNRRAYARFQDYYDQWKNTGTPIPWLKIAGECLIAWVRERHPEVLDA